MDKHASATLADNVLWAKLFINTLFSIYGTYIYMFRAFEKRYVTTDEEGSVVLAEVLQSQIVDSSALSDTVRSVASDVKLKT